MSRQGASRNPDKRFLRPPTAIGEGTSPPTSPSASSTKPPDPTYNVGDRKDMSADPAVIDIAFPTDDCHDVSSTAALSNFRTEIVIPERGVVPFYRGEETDDLHRWQYCVQRFIKAKRIPRHLEVDQAEYFLEDAALDFFRDTLRTGLMHSDLGALVASLEETFHPIDDRLSLLYSLFTLRHGGNMQKFHGDLLRLCTRIGGIPDDIKIIAYVLGLDAETRAAVFRARPTSLSDALRVGASQSMARKAAGNSRAVQSATAPTNSTTANNGAVNRGLPANKGIVCYNCREKGHISADCPKPKNNIPYAKSGVSVGSVLFNRRVVDCHLETKSACMVVDTGADYSSIPSNMVQEIGVSVYPTDEVIYGVSDYEVPIQGITDPVEVKIGDSIVAIPFRVIDDSSGDGILGADYLDVAKCDVSLHTSRLVYGKFTTPLRRVGGPSPTSAAASVARMQIARVVGQWQSEDIDDEAMFLSNVDYDCDSMITIRVVNDNPVVDSLLREYQDVFSHGANDLGCAPDTGFAIRTTSEEPVWDRPRKRGPHDRAIIAQEIVKLLEAGVIRESSSNYSAEVVLVKKKNGEYRLCIDYRPLNAVTIADKTPLPRIDDILEMLAPCHVFSTLDLRAGYWQMPMHPDSIEKTAFSVPGGHYEFLRMPFGLRNAPATFSKFMINAFRDMDFVQVYIDDVTVGSRTTEEHVEHLRVVFARLRQLNLRLNADKCTFAATQVKILGFVVGDGCYRPSSDNISSVSERNKPNDVRSLQSFLGLTNYYSQFIRNYAEICAPFYRLLRKDVEWDWNDACEKSFVLLKEALVASPVLRFPDFTKPFVLYCDASMLAIGAVLGQHDPVGEYVCAYISRTLKGAEVNYGITEKECLAVLYAIRYFRHYLMGAHFTVVTDHAALKWLMTIQDPTGRLARWSLLLQDFAFDVVHRPGNSHTNADALSRPVIGMARASIDEVSVNCRVDPYMDANVMHFLQNGVHRPGLNPKTVKQVLKVSLSYVWRNETVFFVGGENARQLIVPPPAKREEIVNRAHVLGHFDAMAVIARIREHFYWPRMVLEVKRIVGQCRVCQRHNIAHITHGVPQSLEVSGLFERVGMDIITSLPMTEQGNCGILVITEYLSKFPMVYPITTKSAEEVGRCLFSYISLFGAPKTILTDQGREFVNSTVAAISELAGVERVVTSPYHPATNGLTERFNRTLVNVLAKHAERNPTDWDAWLDFVMLAYRSRKNSTTGWTPFELMFGKKMFIPDDEEYASWLPKNDVDALSARINEITTWYKKHIPQAATMIKKKQEKQRAFVEKSRTTTKLPVGSYVNIRLNVRGNKLAPRTFGPYRIHKELANGNYQLTTMEGVKLARSHVPSALVPASVPNVQVPSEEVECILRHRYRGGRVEYLVRWMGFDASHDSWEPETSFDSDETINHYWSDPDPSLGAGEV
jgi:hypothetical protein